MSDWMQRVVGTVLSIIVWYLVVRFFFRREVIHVLEAHRQNSEWLRAHEDMLSTHAEALEEVAFGLDRWSKLLTEQNANIEAALREGTLLVTHPSGDVIEARITRRISSAPPRADSEVQRASNSSPSEPGRE